MNFPTTINPESKRFLPHGTDNKPLVSTGFLFMEQWKAIANTNNKVFVSNQGRILSYAKFPSGKILNLTSIDRLGYVHIGIRCESGRKMFLVSRLVAISFIPNPENKPQVNHKDGNKSNNSADNLEWTTISENIIHAVETGLIKPRKGEKSNFAKITQSVADKIRNEFNTSLPKMNQYLDIANKYGICERHVRAILSNKLWNK